MRSLQVLFVLAVGAAATVVQQSECMSTASALDQTYATPEDASQQQAHNNVQAVQSGLSKFLSSIRENVIKLLPKEQQQQQQSDTPSASNPYIDANVARALEEHREWGLKVVKQLCDTVGNKVQQFIRPAQEYGDLVQRYQRWFGKHQALEAKSGGKIRPALDIVREEYAKLDEELMREKCSGDKDQIRSKEHLDFVFDVINKLTGKLEARLEKEAELADVDSAELQQLKLAELDEGTDDQQVTNAFERVKRITLKSAAETVINEAPRLVKFGLIHAAAVHFHASPAQANTPMWAVQDTIQLLGSASVPVAVMYLRDLQVRTALMMFDAILPLDKIACEVKKQLPFDVPDVKVSKLLIGK